jgi:LysR family transcriptional regulator for metE and metH
MERMDAPANPILEVRELRVVLALARATTTARAARLLALTQPAVSRALLGAEEKLGVRLFDRRPRGLEITPQGQRLVAGAAQLLSEMVDLERDVRGPRPAPRRLRVVAECYTAYHWLPSALLALRHTLPDLSIQLSVEHTNDPLTALDRQELDVALVTTSTVGKQRAAWLAERPLFSDELVFVVSSDHALAARKALTPDDLRRHPLLTTTVRPDEGRWFRRMVFGRQRPALRVERLPLTEAILDSARAGLGVAVLSEWMAGMHLGRGDLVTKRLVQGPLVRRWRFVYRRDVAEAALQLLPALMGSSRRPK